MWACFDRRPCKAAKLNLGVLVRITLQLPGSRPTLRCHTGVENEYFRGFFPFPHLRVGKGQGCQCPTLWEPSTNIDRNISPRGQCKFYKTN